MYSFQLKRYQFIPLIKKHTFRKNDKLLQLSLNCMGYLRSERRAGLVVAGFQVIAKFFHDVIQLSGWEAIDRCSSQDAFRCRKKWLVFLSIYHLKIDSYMYLSQRCKEQKILFCHEPSYCRPGCRYTSRHQDECQLHGKRLDWFW